MQQFLSELTKVYTGAQAGITHRWSSCNYNDKAIFTTSSIPGPIYWAGGNIARPIPGLPSDTGFDGVEALSGRLVFWKGETITWSDQNDFTMFIPVSTTAVSFRANTTEDFVQPSVGQITDWIHLDRADGSFVVGQFVRIDLNPESISTASYQFYTVAEASNPAGVSATTIQLSQTVPASATKQIFTQLFSAWTVGGKLLVNGADRHLQITAASRDLLGVFTASSPSEEVPPVGSVFHVPVAENPTQLKVGDVFSIGLTAAPGLDLYEVTGVSFNLALRRLGVGTNKQAQGFKFPAGAALYFQPFVTVENTSASSVTVPPATLLTTQAAVKLIGLGLTGESSPGSTIPSGSTIVSVDANSAGSTVNTGSQINGEIFAIVAIGEYGAILKERSIQSIQDVGVANGIFYIRPEIVDEGLLGRYTWTRMGDGKIVFLGHKELYEYTGGYNLTPICQTHTKQIFSELDRSRVDEILMYHHEPDTQLWLIYPTLDGQTRSMVYNYTEGSIVQDDYDASLGGLTAIGAVDWELAPTWNDMGVRRWNTETLRWYEYVDEGLQRYTLIATGGEDAIPALGDIPGSKVPRLLLHGRKFSRSSGDNCAPTAIYSIAETQDQDFEDSQIWKYLDTVVLDVEIQDDGLGIPHAGPMKLYVQVGTRENLDSDIAWSAPAAVEVSGNGVRTTKVNIRAAGRFIRIRFFSRVVGVQWRIAGFVLIARPGGTY